MGLKRITTSKLEETSFGSFLGKELPPQRGEEGSRSDATDSFPRNWKRTQRSDQKP